ncbi:MAG: ABC transporter permease, partial [Bacteroidota bacterium]
MPFFAIGLSYLFTKYGLTRLLSIILGRVPVFVADRYLFSRQNRGAINIITFISVLGITYVTYVLIVILSVFNGFQGLIEGMYTAFDPDIRIVAAKGKTLPLDYPMLTDLRDEPEIRAASPVIQDKAMLTYYDKQYMVELKGVKDDYLEINRIDTLIYEGEYSFETTMDFPSAVLGGSVAYFINARLSDRVHPMQLWASGDAKDLIKNPEAAVRTRDVFASAYFKVQMEYDTKYVLADFALVQDLF